MSIKKFEVFVIVTIIALFGIIYAFTQKPVLAPIAQNQNQQQTSDDQNTTQQVPTTLVSYQGVEGKTALELLQASHQVGLKHYSFGDMVESIDGVGADNTTNFWEFLVNDKQAEVGASSYITKSSDTITWKLSTINSTQ